VVLWWAITSLPEMDLLLHTLVRLLALAAYVAVLWRVEGPALRSIGRSGR
jgi:hypothetical protein